MNRSRMILVASAALVLLGGRVQAQAYEVLPGMPEADSMYVPRSSLFDGMQLTKAQQDSIDAITRHYLRLYDALNKENGDVHISQRQFLALREKSRLDRRAVLTPAQQKLFDPRAAAQRADDERISKAMIAKMDARKP